MSGDIKNSKVHLYSKMPPGVKQAMTDVYTQLRKRREWLASFRLRRMDVDRSRTRVVYITGFPRSGTTMLKYYFALHDGLAQSAFNPVGFFDVWRRAQNGGPILVDKSNHYLYSLENIFRGCGRTAKVCVILRDPRDCLVSFTRYHENREVPRDAKYWSYWARQHDDLLKFAERNPFADCLFAVRYEDLVRFPEHAKAAFLRWVGFDVTAEDLDRRYYNQHPGEGWHDSVHDYSEVGTHELQKWSKEKTLPGWASDLMPRWQEEPLAVEMMRQMGYTADGFTDPEWTSEKLRLFEPK